MWWAGGVLASVVALAGPAAARAQTDAEALWVCDGGGFGWGAGPAFVATPEGRGLGVRATAGGCRTGHGRRAEGGYPRSWVLHLQADALVPLDRDHRVPDANTLRAGAGLSVSLSTPPPRAPRNLSPDELLAWSRAHPGTNRGFVEAMVVAGYESDSAWREHLGTVGLDLRWGINAGDWRRILPSVVARLDAVRPFASDARDALGVAARTHGRWSVQAYWNQRLDFLAPWLERVQLQADGALYRTFGLEQELVNRGWHAGEHGTVTLRWTPRSRAGRVGVSSVYGRYSFGQWPTEEGERDGFTAGVTLRVGR